MTATKVEHTTASQRGNRASHHLSGPIIRISAQMAVFGSFRRSKEITILNIFAP